MDIINNTIIWLSFIQHIYLDHLYTYWRLSTQSQFVERCHHASDLLSPSVNLSALQLYIVHRRVIIIKCMIHAVHLWIHQFCNSARSIGELSSYIRSTQSIGEYISSTNLRNPSKSHHHHTSDPHSPLVNLSTLNSAWSIGDSSSYIWLTQSIGESINSHSPLESTVISVSSISNPSLLQMGISHTWLRTWTCFTRPSTTCLSLLPMAFLPYQAENQDE